MAQQVLTDIDAMLHDPAEHLFIVVKRENLGQLGIKNDGVPTDITAEITRIATFMAQLNRDGYITIKDRSKAKENGTYIDLAIRIAEMIGADLNDPTCRGLICTCPTECDCQNYEAGLVSNECPIHNENPQPAIDCPQHGSE